MSETPRETEQEIRAALLLDVLDQWAWTAHRIEGVSPAGNVNALAHDALNTARDRLRSALAGAEAQTPTPTLESDTMEQIRDAALEEAAQIADEHWPERGHVPEHGAISCAMSISVLIRRLKSTYPREVEVERAENPHAR